jgi:putative Mg2+ transporter-C (MgtC) family protein
MDTNRFFGILIDPLSVGGKIAIVLLAVLLGGLVGFERQWRGNAAGLRTHILVCVGATIITLTSVEVGLGVRGGMRGDPGHIAAQIVSGVGFLGAGAILREGMTVHGLTTAASIWAVAGVGIALGASPRLGELAVIATAVILVTLTLISRLEEALKLKQEFTSMVVEVDEAQTDGGHLLELLFAHGITVYGIQSEPGAASLRRKKLGATRQMQMQVRLPKHFDQAAFTKMLAGESGIVAFHLD